MSNFFPRSRTDGGGEARGFHRVVTLVAMTVAMVTLVGVGLAGCEKSYDQKTPDGTVASAFKMLKEGQADKLPKLIYADSREFRSVLGRLGKLTGALQDLGTAVARKFPADVAKLKASAPKSIAEQLAGTGPGTGSGAPAPAPSPSPAPSPTPTPAPAPTPPGSGSSTAPTSTTSAGTGAKPTPNPMVNNFLANLSKPANKPAAPSGSSAPANAAAAKPPAPGDDAQRVMFESIVGNIFADPFSWLTAMEGRLTTQLIADDQAAILLDGQPVPPVGLTMRKADGNWYIELPLNLPVLSGYMPQTFNEWSIVGSLIRVLENTVRELTDEVNAGRVNRIEALAEKAGEKAFLPAAMVFVAYGKEMDVRQRREKLTGELRKKLNEWAKTRKELGDDRDGTRKFVDATMRLAAEDLDVAIRKRVADPNSPLPQFGSFDDQKLSGYVQGLFKPAGVDIDLSPATNASAYASAAEKAATYRRKGKAK